MDESNVPAWHDFFTVSGTAAAALLGLVLVAISLHLEQIERDPLLRNRAFVTLQALTTALVISLVALIPHVTALWFGAITVAVNAAYIGLLGWSLLNARRMAGGIPGHVWRRVIPNALALVSMAAGISLMLGQGPGLFLLAPSVILLLPAMMFSTWNLLFPPELHLPNPDRELK